MVRNQISAHVTLTLQACLHYFTLPFELIVDVLLHLALQRQRAKGVLAGVQYEICCFYPKSITVYFLKEKNILIQTARD